MAHDSTPVPSPPLPRRMGRLMRAGLWLAALVLAVLLLAALALWAALRTEGGTTWVLARVPGLEVSGGKGHLLGDFEARRLVYRPSGGAPLLILDDFGWRNLGIVRTLGGRWRIVIDELRAARVQFDPPPAEPSAEPRRPPGSLALPIELQIRALRIGEFHTPALGGTPLRELRAQVQLGANHGGLHRVDDLTLAWGRLQASARLHIASQRPFALQASAELTQDAAASPLGAPWQASATLVGPLARPELRATLRAQPTGGRPEQTLDVAGTLQPFAAWPIPSLRARTAGLDLSTLIVTAPTTALSGEVAIESRAVDQPATAHIALSNDAAGRWSEGRLPVRSLNLALQAQPGAALQVEVQSADIELGNAQQAGGRVRGSGRWTAAQWRVDAMLDGVRPAQLDARAPSMQLAGPVSLTGSGFDSAGLEQAMVELEASLSGALTDARGRRLAGRSVRATLAGTGSLRRIELRSATLAAGESRATLAGSAVRDAVTAPWRVAGEAALVDFDPAAWWPGRDDSPWRRGPHRLNAQGSFDLVLPEPAPAVSLPSRIAALRGSVSLTLEDSRLAGVPLSGEVSLKGTGARAADAALQLDLAGNRIEAEGRLVTAADGAGDRWTLSVDAPALARLEPIYRLLPGGATLAGALSAQAQIEGRWPAIATQGRLEGQGLVVGNIAVAQARAQWQVAGSPQAPLDVQATLSQLVIGAQTAPAGQPAKPSQTIESVRLTVNGSLADHTAELRAEARALPPAWTELVQPPPGTAPRSKAADAPARTVAQVKLQGGVIEPPAPSTGPWHIAGWRGTLQQLDLRSSAAGAMPWVSAGNIALEWVGGAAPQATVQPGRAEVLGAALRWSRIHWRAATATQPAQIEAHAELEPLPIAPILARLQPEFGWGGDLAIGGTLDLRSAPGFQADVVLERRGGDLSVTEETGTRALGLTDLRLALTASDGVWTFTQALAGTTLGVAAGAVVARTSPEATWPGADTPIQGVLEIQVADLGTWGNWVPPGWRLAGSLRTSASIGGRFGAPEYTGEVRGTGLGVRNFLEGVDVRDGELAIALQGATARIERFTARAGDGTVSLDGAATLGEAPQARLSLTAERFRLLGRVDRRLVVSGQAQLELDAERLALAGRFRVDEGRIDFTRSDAPALSDDVIVVRAGSTREDEPADKPAGGAKRNVVVDLHVDLGDNLRLKGRGLDTRLAGELHITAPGGQLALFGTVRTVEGTYDAYGQKLAIDRGNLIFNGPVENPRLDIEATRRNTDIRVGVSVTGTALDPRVRLFSDPEMSEMDKLSWLVLGRASSGLGGADTALLQRAALALLAGEGEGTGDQLTRAIGLDELSVGQSDDGGVEETVVRLGKQLSRRWYVGYERGLNATTGTWQLIYRIARRFTLRAQSGLDNSLDVIWTWRWD